MRGPRGRRVSGGASNKNSTEGAITEPTVRSCGPPAFFVVGALGGIGGIGGQPAVGGDVRAGHCARLAISSAVNARL